MNNLAARFVIIVFTATLLGGLLYFDFPEVSKAQTLEELRQQIDRKNDEIKKLEEEAKKYRDEIVYSQNKGKTLKAELFRIEKVIGQLRRDMTLTERRIERTAFEIEGLNLEILSKEASVKKMRRGVGFLLQSVSENDDKFIIGMLLESPLSEFFGQLEFSSQIQRRLLASMETLRILRQELEAKKTEAENKNTELKGLKGSLQDKKIIQEGVKKDKSSLIAITKNQEKKYQELLAETEKKQIEILKEIEELEEELRKKVDPSSLPKETKGFLAWPAEGILSQGYGETPFTKSNLGKAFYKFHNGIDIAAAIGTPIKAAADGRVVATGDTDRFCPKGAYGKFILLDHRNNLSTVYAHLSLIKVSAGQEVKKGDIVGNMGSTGLSTGPHVHFTVYDSRTVEMRKGVTGACGIMPFGGSLNPFLYL